MNKSKWFLLLAAPLALLVCTPGAQAQDDSGRWELKGKGVVVDTFSDLEWTQRDNLSDINWQNAKAHCASLTLAGGGWRLPSMQELSMVFTGGRDGTTPCGKWTCQVSSKFYLTGPVFWSNDPGKGSSEAWGMGLSSGGRYSNVVSVTGSRALCVRRSS